MGEHTLFDWKVADSVTSLDNYGVLFLKCIPY